MPAINSLAVAVALCGLMVFGITGCTAAHSASPSNRPAQSTRAPGEGHAADATPNLGSHATGDGKTKLAAANNEFGFDLFNQLLRQDKDTNIFVSPMSVAFALAMTYNGAAGETKRAMEQALKFKGMNDAEIDQAGAALMSALKSDDPQIEMVIANSLWAKDGVTFHDDFLARNRQFLGAEIASLDFESPQAKDRINGWVSRNTKGKIPSIIDRIDAQQVLFAINAVYFKGQWQKKFDKALTKTEPFHLASGSQKSVRLMSQSGNYLYLRGGKFQAVSLPYGKGGTSLCLFLPDEESSLNELLKDLTYEKWERWAMDFRSTPGDVKIPRFKLDYARSLNDPLKALGLGVAFTDRADFSGMRGERDLFISEVKHKAVVEINEEGTEAAAATSVVFAVAMARPRRERFTFIADRPFLMAIRDQETGAILFMAAVFEPK